MSTKLKNSVAKIFAGKMKSSHFKTSAARHGDTKKP